MVNRSIFLLILLVQFGCVKDDISPLDEQILSDYIAINSDKELDDLIACAGGRMNGLNGSDEFPTSVFFYPIEQAFDFRYFEAENLEDSLNFNKYFQKDLTSEPIFNGYLWKFNNTAFDGERMGVVTFKTPGKFHYCTPIRQKTNNKPTEVNADLLSIVEDGTSPSFHWQDGVIQENVIYFQIISDSEDNLISGTYTLNQNFTFYDLSNVVLNISPVDPLPTLESNEIYTFTLMAVSEDNWVNLFIEEDFMTP